MMYDMRYSCVVFTACRMYTGVVYVYIHASDHWCFCLNSIHHLSSVHVAHGPCTCTHTCTHMQVHMLIPQPFVLGYMTSILLCICNMHVWIHSLTCLYMYIYAYD